VPVRAVQSTFRPVEGTKELSQNLSDFNVTRRLRAGIVMLTVALVLAAVFEKTGASPYMRLWLFVPFFFAENAFFQAIHKTCGFSASAGMRHTKDGDERIADPRELTACRASGKKQVVQTLLSAAALTGLFVWIS